MKRWLWTAGVFLCLGLPCLGQGGGIGGAQPADDHDDAAPVQVGYAVITAASSATGLTVMETFGFNDGTETAQASLGAPDLITSATMFVDVSDRLERNVGVAIVNPGNAATSVTLVLFKSDGTQLASRTITVGARQQVAKFVTELIPVASAPGGIGSAPAPLAEYTGTLVMASTSPISVLGIRFRGDNFSALPVTNLGTGTTPILPIMSTGVGGANAALLPQFAANGGWATQIVISNSNFSNATVRLDLFKQDGTPLTTKLNGTNANIFNPLIVPARGVLVLAPRDVNGDDRF